VLLAVPNLSEGRDAVAVAEIADAFAAGGARLLDIHSDPDHNRSVVTLSGEPGALGHSLLAGAREAVERIDLTAHRGLHPHVGALDVAPLVHLAAQTRGAACAEALLAADLISAELAIPVFLYGALAGGRTRAELRRGGPAQLARRMRDGELQPDFGPPEAHPTAGATLVAARPPLVAFNVELAPPATKADAMGIAAGIREGGPAGLPGVRAIGLELAARDGVAQSRSTSRITSASRSPRSSQPSQPRADRRCGARRPGARSVVRRLPRERPRAQPPHDRRGRRL